MIEPIVLKIYELMLQIPAEVPPYNLGKTTLTLSKAAGVFSMMGQHPLFVN